jgi:hypothetical protein
MEIKISLPPLALISLMPPTSLLLKPPISHQKLYLRDKAKSQVSNSFPLILSLSRVPLSPQTSYFLPFLAMEKLACSILNIIQEAIPLIILPVTH